jgi:hypothetical protein
VSESRPEVTYLAGGDVYLWLEQESSVMLKAVTSSGDPVELEEEDARQLAAVLLRFADWLEADRLG